MSYDTSHSHVHLCKHVLWTIRTPSKETAWILTSLYLRHISFSCRENLPSRFKFKEYCPMVFRNLRERFGIDDQDYQVR